RARRGDHNPCRTAVHCNKISAATMSATSSIEKSAPTRPRAISGPQRPRPSQAAVLPMDHLLFVQRTLGNRAVERFLTAHVVQPQLEMGAPGDVFEQEADRVADTVMRMPASARAAAKEHDGHSGGVESAPSNHSFGIDGEPLSPATRAFFE